MRNLSINILCAVNWFIKFVWTVIWVVHKNLLTCPILYIKTWKKTILTRNIRKVETSLNYWDNCKLVHCWATLIRNLLSYWGIRMCVQYLFSYPRTYTYTITHTVRYGLTHKQTLKSTQNDTWQELWYTLHMRKAYNVHSCMPKYALISRV